MSAQPQWVTPAGSLGTIPEGVFYSVPLQAVEPVITLPVTNIVLSNTLSMTLVFDLQTNTPFEAGTNVVLDGFNPSSYNGTYTVLSGTKNSITIATTHVAPIVKPYGTISNIQTSVRYTLLAGQLPEGMQLQQTGVMLGTPFAVTKLQGVPGDVVRNITSRFAVRAYTEKTVNGVTVINRLADRTFELTVTGPNGPEFVDPPGQLAQYYDGTEVYGLQVQYTTPDPGQVVTVRLVSGQLPPGLSINNTGLISGFIPVTPEIAGTGWYDANGESWDLYPYNFSPQVNSINYEFVLEVTDGVSSELRTFSIFVWSRSSMTADNTVITADNTFITADVSPVRAPIILNKTGSIGTVRNDNFFAYQFNGIDFDGEPFTIFPIITVGSVLNVNVNPPGDPQVLLNSLFPSAVAGSGVIDQTLDELWVYDGAIWDNFGPVPVGYTSALPPGLTLDPVTGWLYGLIPDTGITSNTYSFSLLIKKTEDPNIFSGPYNYSLTVDGPINSEVVWLTPTYPNILGTIDNGSISTLFVQAQNLGGLELQYELYLGIEPEITTTYLPTGSSGTTLRVASTQGIRIGSLIVGTGFSSGQTVLFKIDETTLVISSPPNSTPGNQLTFKPVTESNPQYNLLPQGLQLLSSGDIAGRCSFNTFALDGGTTTFDVTKQNGENPTTFDLTFRFTVRAFSVDGVVDVTETFLIRVIRRYNEPYENLYIQCMPPQDDRDLINDLLLNSDIFPPEALYRPTDPNFGVARNVIYNHAYGLTASTIDKYYQSLQENHYWKNLVLGQIKTAQARNSAGEVIYEVVYSQVVDNLVNNQGESVDKQVDLAYPIDYNNLTNVNEVYPNSLINMRDQVIDVVGQISNILPDWMISQQANGRVLGFVPAWVIAYTKPGQAERIAYNIRTQFDRPLNLIDFEVDRYELDRLLTKHWNPELNSWVTVNVTPTEIIGSVIIDTNDENPQTILNTAFPNATVGNAVLDLSKDEYWVLGLSPNEILDITKPSPNTLSITLRTNSPFEIGQSVTISGVSPTGFNGTYQITGISGASLIVSSNFSGTYRYGGSILGTRWFNSPQLTTFDVSGEAVEWQNNSLQTVQWVNDNSIVVTWVSGGVAGEPTTFDQNSMQFIAPVDMYSNTQIYDKYLVFPKRNILQ